MRNLLESPPHPSNAPSQSVPLPQPDKNSIVYIMEAYTTFLGRYLENNKRHRIELNNNYQSIPSLQSHI